MIVQDLINSESLRTAQLIVGGPKLNETITGINILEAADIEKWGKPGMVILTSFFALEHLNEQEHEQFFKRMETVGIVCLIVKVRRLLAEIPEGFVKLCQKYSMPLLRIDDHVKYHDIIMDVLSSILSRREKQLAMYYDANKISSAISLELLNSREVLKRYKSILGYEFILQDLSEGSSLSTNSNYEHYEIIDSEPLPASEYITHDYTLQKVLIGKGDQRHELTALCADISILEARKHRLCVFSSIDGGFYEREISLIESLILCLKLSLLREFYGKQRKMLNLNTLINEILRGLISDPQEFISTCQQLGFSPTANGQVLTIQYKPNKSVSPVVVYNLKSRVRSHLHDAYERSLYYMSPNYDQFLLIHEADSNKEFLSNEVQACILSAYGELQVDQNEVAYYAGVSDMTSIKDCSTADYQSKAITDFLIQVGSKNQVMLYRGLGIFKLLFQQNLDNLFGFIPQELVDLQKNNKEAYKTLYTFLRNRQSYLLTAKELYLHPKTVKYRIDKLVKSLHFNLDNVHDITILLTSFEILEFIKRKSA